MSRVEPATLPVARSTVAYVICVPASRSASASSMKAGTSRGCGTVVTGSSQRLPSRIASQIPS